MNLAVKIKALRSQKGISQAELAHQSGVSLRTIQRIELNENTPRGFTLNSIAAVLGVTHEELITNEKIRPSKATTFIHLSALGFIVFPLLGFLFPLITWVIKKDQSEYDDVAARKLLNFQATWCILLVTIYIMAFSGKVFHFGTLGVPETIIFSILSMYLINFLLIIANVFRTVKSKSVFYQPAIPFFS